MPFKPVLASIAKDVVVSAFLFTLISWVFLVCYSYKGTALIVQADRTEHIIHILFQVWRCLGSSFDLKNYSHRHFTAWLTAEGLFFSSGVPLISISRLAKG